MSPAIEVSDLRFSRGKTVILEEVSLSVDRGSFHMIIGPNGSGKTTLMKILAGIEKADTADLNILGSPLSSYTRKALARNIAFVPQSFSSEFPFKVEEMVLYGRSPHLGMLGVPGEEDLAVARKAMEFTGIDRLADRRVDLLSGGEQQRVSIARAVCQEAEVILLDEPTSALDLSHQILVMDLLEKLKNDQGTTVVMVSHDINLAAIYGDTLTLLFNGRIKATGSPAEVVDPSILEAVYGCTVLVDKSPFGELPRVSPVPGRFCNFTS